MSRGFRNSIYVRAAFHLVLDVALLLQPLENGSGGRVFHGMALGQSFAHILSGTLRPRPHYVHHQMFQFG
jgi:hypothetical protein